MPTVSDPHGGQPVLRSGASPKDARLVAIMLHGRGASAEDILGLAHQFSAGDIAYLAPQARTRLPEAAGGTFRATGSKRKSLSAACDFRIRCTEAHPLGGGCG